MVCTANDLQEWKDFPKGLKVLLLEGDTNSASEIKAKLESMNYNVSVFCDEDEALSAILSRSDNFHIAIVEVSISSGQGGFKFLENARDLPTIMTSNNHCLNTMMKCIALGAAEFLSKPLSEDKLRNIWQHVVHKAFNAGASVVSESLKPVKESVVSMLQLQTDSGQQESGSTDNDHDSGSDKYPAPSTPQLNQGARSMDDRDCQEQTNCSTEKDSGEHDGEGETKSAETTCENLNAESTPRPMEHDGEGESKSADIMCENMNAGTTPQSMEHDREGESKSAETTCKNSNAESTPQPMDSEKTLVKDEEDFAKGSRDEMRNGAISTHPHNRKVRSSTDGNKNSSNKAGFLSDSCAIKAHRKKMKVDWTPELHKKFVKAVEQLGLDQAIPSRILDLMKVEGLTRHNVASHLQKYRMHKRQILPKDEDRKWLNQRDPMQRSYRLQRPIMAFPPYHPNHTLSPAPVYPMWTQPGGQTPAMHVWGPPGFPMWQPLPGMHADAWGCPVFPPPPPCFSYPQNMPGILNNTNAGDYKFSMPQKSFEHYPADEVVDKVVKEAINKPWLPLPLGLKAPSTDSVLAELSRQGISTVPPCVRH